MRIKRVHAPDIQTALARVRAELGPDAVIIATRPLGDTPDERRRGLSGVELVAGVDDQAPVSAVAQARQVAQSAGAPGNAEAARAAYTGAMAAGQEPANPSGLTPASGHSSPARGRGVAGGEGTAARALPGVPLSGVRSADATDTVRRPTFPRLTRAGTFADELERLIPARAVLAAHRQATMAADHTDQGQRAALLDLIRVKHEEFMAAGRSVVPSYVPGTNTRPSPALASNPSPASGRGVGGEGQSPPGVRDGQEEPTASPAHAAAERAFDVLCAAGLGERVAEEAVTAAIRSASRATLADPERLVELALTCLARTLPPDPTLAAATLAGRALLFVGPAGVGKTTALLKAALYLRRAGAEVAVAGADVSRLGALEQLQRYGALLRLPVRPVYEPDDLKALLAAAPDAQITLVDTPACGPGPAGEREEVVALIRAATEPLVVLTMAAGVGEGELHRWAAAAQALAATAVAVTRLDETEAPAAALRVPAALRLAVLLCSSGRDITAGLHTPTPDELGAAVLKHVRQGLSALAA